MSESTAASQLLVNRTKRLLRSGRPTFGYWMRFPSPELIEFIGHFGLDFVVIDGEHFAFGREATQQTVRAAQLTGTVPLVRVPKNDHELILGYLETGALGIVVPHIRTADDAVRAVRAVKYHPLGDRSSGAFSRAANYGVTQTAAEYLSRANDETMVVLLVEDVEGFENLEGIIAVEGIDAVMLGQSDLAMSMGLPGQGDHPSVRSLVGAARDMLRGSAVALSATVRTADEARRAVADGATFIDLNLYAAWDSPLREFAGLSRNEEL